MNKRHKAVLLGTMITLALQTGSAYAETYDEIYERYKSAYNYYDIEGEKYENYVEFGTGTETDLAGKEQQGYAGIHVGESSGEQTFTFKNGVTIDGSKRVATARNYSHYTDKAPIANVTNNNLTINVGNENDKSNFILKTENNEVSSNSSFGYGISVAGTGKNIINVVNTDFQIIGKSYTSGIRTLNNSELTIDGQNTNTNIKIEGNFAGGFYGGIVTGGGSKLEIKDVNDVEILPNLHDTIGNYSNGMYLGGNSKVSINSNNFSIGDNENNKIGGSIGIYLNDSANLNLDIENDIDINSNLVGIGALVNSSEERSVIDSTITAENIKIDAIDPNNKGAEANYISDFGTAVGIGLDKLFSKEEQENRIAKIGLIADNEINLSGVNNGVFVSNNANFKMNADKIYISGSKAYGILNYVMTEDYANSTIDITAKNDVNIYGSKAGAFFYAGANDVDIKSTESNIIIRSDEIGIEADKLAPRKEGTDINFEAKKNISFEGGTNGIKSYLMRGKLKATSTEGNIYIKGNETAIVIDSQDEEKTNANTGKEEIILKTKNTKSDGSTGNIYIGGIENENEILNQKGISNSGKNIIDIDANNILQIEGKEVALEAKKETDNDIKRKYINI